MTTRPALVYALSYRALAQVDHWLSRPQHSIPCCNPPPDDPMSVAETVHHRGFNDQSRLSKPHQA